MYVTHESLVMVGSKCVERARRYSLPREIWPDAQGHRSAPQSDEDARYSAQESALLKERGHIREG